MGDLPGIFLRDVIHLGSAAGLADRKVILWPMTLALLTFAAGIAAALVALDERAAKNKGLDPGHLFDQSLAPTEQCGSGLAHEQTSYITGQSLACHMASSILFPMKLTSSRSLIRQATCKTGACSSTLE